VSGTRTYIVTDANGCSISKTITIPSARPFASSPGKQLLQATVYPNPSSSFFDLWLKQGAVKQTAVIVTTADGKLLYKTEGKQPHFIFGETFAPGLYIVTVKQGTTSETFKIVKIL
jgi:Secretion system C-terminal sorting domain